MERRARRMTDFDSCGQKAPYKTIEEAWANAARQNRESLGNVIKKPYRCKICKQWHLTTIN